ncbi:hypothetical protein EJP617_15080 [Erwinia sp. Ejp617]|nr:hypothetical protein EJP617_15080 [Erwinia sp. Ejp617]
MLFTTTLENRVHIELRFRACLFCISGCAINIHNRARILRNFPAKDKCLLHCIAEKKRKVNGGVSPPRFSSTICHTFHATGTDKGAYHSCELSDS